MESNEASVPFLRRVARDLTRQHQGQLHRLGIIFAIASGRAIPSPCLLIGGRWPRDVTWHLVY